MQYGSRSIGTRLGRVVVAATLVLSACATDDADDTDAAEPDPQEPAAATINVRADNYFFDGIPVDIEAGSILSLTNQASDEVHEIVAFRLPEDEQRSAAELTALPEEELEQALGGPPATVIVALPGEEGVAVEGDGSLNDPGRYLFLCLIPVGADPDVYAEAMQNPEDGPPEVEDAGPPHFVEGMFSEAVVR